MLSVLEPNSVVSVVENFGNIEQRLYEETQADWKITDFFSVIGNTKNNDYKSSTFTFADNSWRFHLRPKSTQKPGFITLFIGKLKLRDYPVECTFGLKTLNGNVEELVDIIFAGSAFWSVPLYVIKASDVLQRKSELAPNDVLTFTCTLKRRTPYSSQPSMLNKLIKLDTLSENFKHFFSSGENCDTILHIQDKEFKVHKAVLIARSSVFAAMFHHESKEKQTGIIFIPDCNPESFEEFLKFLYCGKLEGISSRSAIQLYETSDKYDVQELKTFCIEYLRKNLTMGDFYDSVVMADKYDDVKLFSAAQEFFNENATEVLQTFEWELLMKKNFRLGNKLLIEMSKKAMLAMVSKVQDLSL